jgi:hypothetical protein
MIGDDIKPSGLERAEDGLVHRCPIHAEMPEVVVVEHQSHDIDTLRREFGWKGICERSGNGDD